MAARGRAWRAARSLHWNRLLLEVVEARVERAEATLRSYLALSEESRLELGAFTVECEGGELQVTRRSVVPSGQLELPEVDGHGLAPADSLEAPIAAADPSSLQESGRDVGALRNPRQNECRSDGQSAWRSLFPNTRSHLDRRKAEIAGESPRPSLHPRLDKASHLR